LLRRIIGLAVVGGVAWVVIFGIPGAGPATCTTLVSDVVKISAENSNGFAAKVIDLVETKEISKTDKELKCAAIGILSSGMKQPIVYRSYEEYGKWWVQFQPEGLPFS
jgi:high-affinity K+ transport system ATPase subunit B